MFIMIVMSCSKSDYDSYYWYEGKRIPMKRIDGKYYVVFYSAEESKLKNALEKAGLELSDVSEEIKEYYSYSCGETGSGVKLFTNYKTAYIYGNSKQVTGALHHTLYWSPFYRLENGDVVGITELVCVEFKYGTKLSQLENLAKRNFVEIMCADKYHSGWYYLACTNLSKGNSLEMANLFYASGLFKESAPDMLLNIKH